MRRQTCFSRVSLLRVVSICFICVLGLAVSNNALAVDDVIAVMDIQTNLITWQPQVSYERLILSVSGPGDVLIISSFESGNLPSLSLAELSGNPFLDGQYAYELTLVPVLSAEVRAMLIEARESGDDSIVETLQQSGALPQETLTQTGYFQIYNGRFVTERALQTQTISDSDVPKTTRDQVIVDDLIVQSSACIGMDCVNGESFGYDTLRLKENNLRIHFQDTSSTGSFPTTDWRIIINDSANGGNSYFTIEDSDAGRRPFTIEASASANALYIDNADRIGFGTSNPLADLHIAEGNTPTVRLDQDGSAGWTPQVWDLAGNEANFFIRDVTNGSQLPFRIRPGAPTSSLYIHSSGKIGFGTDSPNTNLHIMDIGDVAPGIQLDYTATGINQDWQIIGDSPNFRIYDATNAKNLLTVEANTGNVLIAGNLELASSRTYKDNIRDLTTDEAMETLQHLRPVAYNLKSDPEELSVGFIAEEVPDLVAANGRKSLSPMDIVGVLAKAMQEQQQLIEAQQATITELSERLSELELQLNEARTR